MSQLPSPLAVGALALAAGVVVGMLLGQWWATRARPASGATIPSSPSPEPAGRPEALERIRSQALEAVAEPVVVVGGDGRILECNAAALSLLDRHRPAVTGLDASAIRRLVSPSGLEIDWKELVESRTPWTGEAHVRLPDGSRRAIEVRSVPVFSARGDLAGLVEVYHDAGALAGLPADRFLTAIDALGEMNDREPPADAAERELKVLAMGFSDLDRVMRQYEMLLPAMRAEDPLTEAIAGLAAETSEVVASADVPRLLREIPRSMTRLRASLSRLTGRTPNGG